MTLVNDAKKDFLEGNQLKANQTLANLIVNWKNSFFLPFLSTNRCIVTADIVEFK